MKNKLFWITTSNQSNFESLSIKCDDANVENCDYCLYSENKNDLIPIYKAIKLGIYNSYLGKSQKPSWLTNHWLNEVRES